MMAILTVLLLFLSIHGSSQEVPTNSIWRAVSINSKIHEEKFNMKLIKGDPRCGNFESLNVDGMNLAVIKDDLIQSSALRQVSMRKNFLKNIPDNVLRNIPYLLCLDISKNNLNLYKSNLFKHSHLRILNLSDQDKSKMQYPYSEFNEVVEGVDELSDKLMIFDNTEMYLPSLKYLILTGNDLSRLSWTFSKSFPELTNLYLDNIKAQKLDPDFFRKIPKTLRVLHMENNYLVNLTLQDLAEITNLHLDSNPLKSINIVSQKLQVLSLSNCTTLSYSSLNTPGLKHLDLSMNNLDRIPDFVFQKYISLETIILDHNQFSNVPVISNTQLIALSLSYNKMTYISEDSFKHSSLTSLENLSLRGNKIDRVDENAFSRLRNLEYLDLSENELKNLPYNWIMPLSNLLYLNASTNDFENLSDLSVNLMSSVQHIFVKDNLFTSVSTTELASLPNSVTVYMN